MNAYFWLIISEVLILIFIALIRYIFYLKENKKIDSILDIFKNKLKDKSDKDTNDKFEECIKIIKDNQRKDDENGE